MKQIILIIAILAGGLSLNAQSEKYTAAMKKFLVSLDSARTGEELQNVSNNFERVANAEKTEWLPYYYAAYCLVMKAYQEKDIKMIDALMDKADELLTNAEILAKDNSEVTLLKGMSVQCRMSADQSRYMTLGPKCTKLIKQAESQAPKDNPRAYMMDAQMNFYTPEAFGGGKEKGIDIMKKAIALYGTFQPESDLHPRWGKEYAERTLGTWSK